MKDSEVFPMLVKHFKGDEEKAMLWIFAENPLLGGMSPLQIWLRKKEKLKKFIKTQLESNKNTRTKERE